MDSSKLVDSALKMAHGHSFKNRVEIENSGLCVCFNCKSAHFSILVRQYVDSGETALCPGCSVDTLIGDASGFDLTPAFVQAMHTYWFDSGVDLLLDRLEPHG